MCVTSVLLGKNILHVNILIGNGKIISKTNVMLNKYRKLIRKTKENTILNLPFVHFFMTSPLNPLLAKPLKLLQIFLKLCEFSCK